MPREGGSYEIRVRGRLSDSLAAAFEGMRASVEPAEDWSPRRTRSRHVVSTYLHRYEVVAGPLTGPSG